MRREGETLSWFQSFIIGLARSLAVDDLVLIYPETSEKYFSKPDLVQVVRRVLQEEIPVCVVLEEGLEERLERIVNSSSLVSTLFVTIGESSEKLLTQVKMYLS